MNVFKKLFEIICNPKEDLNVYKDVSFSRRPTQIKR